MTVLTGEYVSNESRASRRKNSGRSEGRPTTRKTYFSSGRLFILSLKPESYRRFKYFNVYIF